LLRYKLNGFKLAFRDCCKTRFNHINAQFVQPLGYAQLAVGRQRNSRGLFPISQSGVKNSYSIREAIE
jgi:hypothetical protein